MRVVDALHAREKQSLETSRPDYHISSRNLRQRDALNMKRSQADKKSFKHGQSGLLSYTTNLKVGLFLRVVVVDGRSMSSRRDRESMKKLRCSFPFSENLSLYTQIMRLPFQALYQIDQNSESRELSAQATSDIFLP